MTFVLSMLGGALALDQTSVGQFMLSRPLVSATLTGWILGDPASGLVAGALLEVLVLPAFPVGGARFPEGGPAGVVAAVAAADGTGGVLLGPGLAAGVALGAVWSQLGGWTITLLRRVNERFVALPEEKGIRASRIVSGHLAALACDFVRGAVLTGLGVAAARLVVPLAEGLWPLGGPETVVALGIVAALSAGGLLTALDGWKRRRGVLLGGVVTGAVVGWLL